MKKFEQWLDHNNNPKLVAVYHTSVQFLMLRVERHVKSMQAQSAGVATMF